jgi:hypothetical protein
MSSKSHTFRPKSGQRGEQECRYCHEIGHAIKERGRIVCPKLIAKETRRDAHNSRRRERETRRQQDWATHIQDISGCHGNGWKTAGSAAAAGWRKRQLVKQGPNTGPRRVRRIKNRFEIPSDSESDEESQKIQRPRISQPRKLAKSSAWSKGAPKPFAAEAAAAALIVAKLERQTAETEKPKLQEGDAPKITWEEVVAAHKPIVSWADACVSDDEE